MRRLQLGWVAETGLGLTENQAEDARARSPSSLSRMVVVRLEVGAVLGQQDGQSFPDGVREGWLRGGSVRSWAILRNNR